jgi:hypothetical protein
MFAAIAPSRAGRGFFYRMRSAIAAFRLNAYATAWYITIAHPKNVEIVGVPFAVQS